MSASDTRSFVLSDDRRHIVGLVAKAPEGWVVTIRPPNRNSAQNRFLHACLTDLAEQLPWPTNGKDKHDIEWWKRRCTLQWLLDDGQTVEVIADLDGEQQIGLLLPHTSHLTTAQCAALSEWVLAFGSVHGVSFRDQRRP